MCNYWKYQWKHGFVRCWRTFIILFTYYRYSCGQLLTFDSQALTRSTAQSYSQTTVQTPIELQGGFIMAKTLRLDKGMYVLREDLIIDTSAEVILDPGVEISFAPMVGITVRGIFRAMVSDEFLLLQIF